MSSFSIKKSKNKAISAKKLVFRGSEEKKNTAVSSMPHAGDEGRLFRILVVLCP
jgi:hypothetical protein